MKCSDCLGNGLCAYNIMLPYYVTKMGSTPIPPESKYISVDKCLLPELLSLWEDGIKTTGCCCGHGIHPAFISIRDLEDVERMMRKGYKYVDETDYFRRSLSFIPKTPLKYGEANKGFNWWIESSKEG